MSRLASRSRELLLLLLATGLLALMLLTEARRASRFAADGELVPLPEQDRGGWSRPLIAEGHAYAAEGHVLFSVASFKDYGKLSNRRVEEQESGTRDLQGSGKRNPADFALWKASKPGDRTMRGEGSASVAAPPEAVWAMLLDPEVLTEVDAPAAFGYDLDDVRWFTVNAMKSAFLPFDERLELIEGTIKPAYAAAR